MFETIFAILIVLLDVWAIINVLGSSESDANKLVWSLVILVLPVLGLIIWWFAGPRGAAA